ncbi:hypothetical protein O3M35_010568 [Rhynocoris fuscipes]|uniref:Uncharacterized protein n=1 Tax=Rhynocoris fuscipes TaxID=488301 RepID=A0AAW1D0E1_9HEMI
MTPNEVQTNTYADDLVLEQRVKEYHDNRELVSRAIKTMIDKEKETRTNRLNVNRENVDIPEGEIFVRDKQYGKAKPRL